MNRINISKETYNRMKELVTLYEGQLKWPIAWNLRNQNSEPEYFETIHIESKLEYNTNYGDDKLCKCGHSYYRHFDSYEEMEAIGCKYCQCFHFELPPPPEPKDEFTLDFERVFGSNKI